MLSKPPRWKPADDPNNLRDVAHDAIMADLRAYVEFEWQIDWCMAEDWQREEAKLMVGVYYAGVAELRLSLMCRGVPELDAKQRAELAAEHVRPRRLRQNKQ